MRESVRRAALHCINRYAINNFNQENLMAKGYWICFYRSISNPDAVVEYAKLAGPAIQGGGGRFLGRGLPDEDLRSGKEYADRGDRIRERGESNLHV